MKSAIDSFTKNSLKVAAVTSLAIGACFVPGKAEAFNIVPVEGSSTRLGRCAPQSTECNVRSSTGIFNFKFLTVGKNENTRVIFRTPASEIQVFVDSVSTFNGIFTIPGGSKKNLTLNVNDKFIFTQDAAYDLNGGKYNEVGQVSGRPKAIPENPVGSLLGAGVVGAVLLLKGRKRFNRLAQTKMIIPEQSNL
jgi:hypothetical protein